MTENTQLQIEELEARFELAAITSAEADAGCCSCSICMGTDCCMDCAPTPT